jgi:hypothetical protein
MATANPYGLTRHTLYRVPPSAVSYHPQLANARGFWTGKTRELPAGGGTMCEFDLSGIGLYWLRPWAVVTA